MWEKAFPIVLDGEQLMVARYQDDSGAPAVYGLAVSNRDLFKTEYYIPVPMKDLAPHALEALLGYLAVHMEKVAKLEQALQREGDRP